MCFTSRLGSIFAEIWFLIFELFMFLNCFLHTNIINKLKKKNYFNWFLSKKYFKKNHYYKIKHHLKELFYKIFTFVFICF